MTHNAVVITATPAKIWPYIVDPNGWKMGVKLLPSGGEPGPPGERFNAAMADDLQNVQFCAQNIEMAADERRTIRLNAPDGALIGFATWRLTPQNGSTLVEYDVYCALPTESTAASSQGLDHDANYRRFREEFAALKRLVEG